MVHISRQHFVFAATLGLSIAGGLIASLSATDAAAAEEGIKSQICNAVGCPDTPGRVCANVSGEVSFPFFSGSVDYTCYEPGALP